MRIAVHHVDILIVLECGRDTLKSSRPVKVIGVQPANDRSGGLSEALPNRVGGTAVFFGYPIRQMMFVLPYEIHTAVRGTSIDDDVFEVRITLKQNRSNRFLKEFSLVE